MKVLFVSPLCSRKIYRASVPEDLRTGQAMQKFHRLLARGLSENGASVQVLSAPPIEKLSGRWFYHPASDEENGVAFSYTRTFRPRALSRITRFVETMWRVWSCAHASSSVVLSDPMNVLPFIAAWIGTRLASTPLVGVVADVPTFYAGNVGKRRKPLPLRVSEFMMTRADAYVLLTPQMNSLVNPDTRPWVVIEGMAETGGASESRPPGGGSLRVMLYSGGIRRYYGLDRLLSAFAELNDPNWEFHIYGGGQFAAEFASLAEPLPQVKFMGVKDNDAIIDVQRRADLLVNPRLSDQEYTHYSFPSKIIEYMTSGTPTLTTRLPGIPDEYAPHLLFFDDESLEGMKGTLNRVFNMAEDERQDMGSQARRWIVDTKSASAQSALVLEMLNRITSLPSVTGCK